MKKMASMYKWTGNQYKVVTREDFEDFARESQPMSYWRARQIVGTLNCRNPGKCHKITHEHHYNTDTYKWE